MVVQGTHHKVSLARLGGKRVEAAFDGGLLTSDSGVMLLREVEARMGILDRIVEALTDRRHPGYVEHGLADLVHQRVFQMPVGMRMPTIAIRCARTLPSRRRATACRSPVRIWPVNPR